MPWLEEELEGWEELTDEERGQLRELLRDLGLELPEEDEADYFE